MLSENISIPVLLGKFQNKLNRRQDMMYKSHNYQPRQKGMTHSYQPRWKVMTHGRRV